MTQAEYDIKSLLGDSIPDNVVLIKFLDHKYCCAFIVPYYVLICFSSIELARLNVVDCSLIYELCRDKPYTFDEVSFDTARNIAKDRDLDALALFDNPTNPVYHYLK